jgi:hypothetical protein
MIGSSSIGDLFLNEGLLITTAGRDGHSVSGLTAEVRATVVTPFRDYPVVFLTSPRTASGSELLAASLRNNDRALLVGERSFGKGTVQKTYSLGTDSSLKLTVGHFLPNGLAIPGNGMVPDIEIHRLMFGAKRVALPSIPDDTELPFWLLKPSWIEIEHHSDPLVITFAENVDDETETPAENQQAEEEDVESDPLVTLAAEMLARYGNVSASRMLDDSRLFLFRRTREADHAV